MSENTPKPPTMADLLAGQAQATDEKPRVPTRAEWLAERRKLITGTDIGKILGFSRFGGPMSVYLEKIGAEDEEEKPGPAMVAGQRIQQTILTWYADVEQVGLELSHPYQLVRVPGAEELLACTLDARWLKGDRRPVDAKNIRWKTHDWGDAETEEVPPEYALQLQVQMAACPEAQAADLAVLFSGQELVLYRIHRDETAIESITDIAANFVEKHIIPQVPPAVDGSESWSRFLQTRIKQSSELMVRVNADNPIVKYAEGLRYLREKEKQLEAARRELENKIKAAIGSNAGVEGPFGRITWKRTKDSEGTDWEALADWFLTAIDDEETKASLLIKYAKSRRGARRFLPQFKVQERERT